MEQVYEHGIWVILGLGVYMMLLLGTEWWATKRVSSEADFLVAGHRLGVPLMIGALAATWYGACTKMGAAGASYPYGTHGLVFDPYGAALCMVLLASSSRASCADRNS